MNPQTRLTVLVGIMFLLLAASAAWSVEWMLAQRRSATRAAATLAECRRLATEIESLRQKPSMASDEAMGGQELGKRINAASNQAGLNRSALQRVSPQPGRRVNGSPYLRKPTILRMQGVKLTKLVDFMHRLTNQTNLNVRNLQLSTPRRDASANAWHADVTLTYLIYRPQAKS
jgi:hypothetical protein